MCNIRERSWKRLVVIIIVTKGSSHDTLFVTFLFYLFPCEKHRERSSKRLNVQLTATAQM